MDPIGFSKDVDKILSVLQWEISKPRKIDGTQAAQELRQRRREEVKQIDLKMNPLAYLDNIKTDEENLENGEEIACTCG